MTIRHVSQHSLTGVFDGEPVLFPARYALRNFHQEPADVADFPRHTVEDQIEVATGACDPLLGKAFHEIPARAQPGDEHPLFSYLGLEVIPFRIGTFALRIAGLTLDDVKFVGRHIGVGLHALVRELCLFDQY